MIVRNISHDDVQAFINCYVTVFSTFKGILPQEYVENEIETASTQEFQHDLVRKLDDRNNILLGATDDEKIIGLAWGAIKENRLGWLSFLGVLAAYRRISIGRTLLCQFIEQCIDRGAHKINLDTDPRLVPAIQLYESMGFSREGFVTSPNGMKLILFGKEFHA
jgi:ribosomal protein S18 acetylase RimI-like enzyme